MITVRKAGIGAEIRAVFLLFLLQPVLDIRYHCSPELNLIAHGMEAFHHLFRRSQPKFFKIEGGGLFINIHGFLKTLQRHQAVYLAQIKFLIRINTAGPGTQIQQFFKPPSAFQKRLRFPETVKIQFLIFHAGYGYPFFPRKLRKELSLINMAGFYQQGNFLILVHFLKSQTGRLKKNFRIQNNGLFLPIPEIASRFDFNTICITEAFLRFQIFTEPVSIDPESHGRILQLIMSVKPADEFFSGNSFFAGSKHTDEKMYHLRSVCVIQNNRRPSAGN